MLMSPQAKRLLVLQLLYLGMAALPQTSLHTHELRKVYLDDVLDVDATKLWSIFYKAVGSGHTYAKFACLLSSRQSKPKIAVTSRMIDQQCLNLAFTPETLLQVHYIAATFVGCSALTRFVKCLVNSFHNTSSLHHS